MQTSGLEPIRSVQQTHCQIACFSDTYGASSNNGVGRFLDNLLSFSREEGHPFHLVVPSKDDITEGVIPVRAPAFSLPVYSKVSLAMPLEVQRRSVRRQLTELNPDIIHVSTPGPFGLFGLSIAAEMKRPVVGIYHTDFPRYAEELVRNHFSEMRGNLFKSLGPLTAQLMSKAGPLVADLEDVNPDFEQDLMTITEIVNKNIDAISKRRDPADICAGFAKSITTQLLRKFYSRFTVVIARSAAQQSELSNQLGINPDRIRLLEPGTDLEQFHPRFADRSIWRAYGISDDDFVALYAGRVTAEKNIALLLDSWNQLLKSQSANARKIRLVIAGYGDEAELKRAAELPGVHVVGPMGNEQLSRLYASSDVLVFPSVTETLGQVGLEAAASGTAVLASNRGGQISYIVDGETGILLSPEKPDVWADALCQLSNDPERSKRLGDQARKHVENHYSIKSSLLSYWNLHAEAIELAAAERAHRTKVRKSQAKSIVSAPEHIQTSGMMLITDYHGGRHCGSKKKRRAKHLALEAMLSKAVENDLEIVYGGDFGDHGANPVQQADDFQVFREIKRQILAGREPLFVRGNHDFGYSDQQLADMLGGCRVHPSLVYFHEQSRVAVTHGHILGIGKTLEVIKQARGLNALQADLTEEKLDQDLKPSIIAYDLANLIESSLQNMGLSGLSPFWEGLYKSRAATAEKLVSLSERANPMDQKTWKLIASLLGSHDDVEAAHWLGVACGSWATLFGHTHEPTALRHTRKMPQSQKSVQIIGNAGNVNRAGPTCVVASFPKVTVYAFDAASNKLRPKSRAGLTEIETLRYASRFPRRNPSLAM